jgi:hypothetical protein
MKTDYLVVLEERQKELSEEVVFPSPCQLELLVEVPFQVARCQPSPKQRLARQVNLIPIHD